MALRIGNKEVIKQETILIPQGERADIPLSFGGDIIVGISYSDDESGQQDIRLSNEGGRMNLILVNWSNGIGTATQAPIDLASNDQGHVLSIMATNYRVGNMNKIDLQFMVE